MRKNGKILIREDWATVAVTSSECLFYSSWKHLPMESRYTEGFPGVIKQIEHLGRHIYTVPFGDKSGKWLQLA